VIAAAAGWIEAIELVVGGDRLLSANGSVAEPAKSRPKARVQRHVEQKIQRVIYDLKKHTRRQRN
jgi:hypothetical protein